MSKVVYIATCTVFSCCSFKNYVYALLCRFQVKRKSKEARRILNSEYIIRHEQMWTNMFWDLHFTLTRLCSIQHWLKVNVEPDIGA